MAEAAEEFPFFLERLRSAFDGQMLVDIAPETSLSQVGLDSLEMLRLVVCIEDLAGFVPDNSDIPSLRTFADAHSYYLRLLRET
jgi:acyl carrier protein